MVLLRDLQNMCGILVGKSGKFSIIQKTDIFYRMCPTGSDTSRKASAS